MVGMFNGCSSLKELDISNFNFDNVNNVLCMFFVCSEQLIMKIKDQFKNIKKEAFSLY